MARSTSMRPHRASKRRRCQHCSATVGARARFCSSCGGALNEQSGSTAGSRTRRTLLVIIIGLILIGIYGSLAGESEPSDRPEQRVVAAGTATLAATDEPVSTTEPSPTAMAREEATETATPSETAVNTSTAPPVAPTDAPTEFPTATEIPAPTETPSSIPTPGPPDGVPARARMAELESIVDGDTISVRYNGKDYRVELIGIDAPELADSDSAVECFAERARNRLDRLMPAGSRIWIEGNAVDRNEFGSLLRYVWVVSDSDRVTFVNEDLLERGLAAFAGDPDNTRHNDRLHDAEDVAIDGDVGLWAECDGLHVPKVPPTPIPSPTPIPTPIPIPPTEAPAMPISGGSSGGCTYINVDGNTVPCPVEADSPPPGATAQCRDGTYSFSQNRRGACSSHGGVARWL